jgi:hypothetical protein
MVQSSRMLYVLPAKDAFGENFKFVIGEVVQGNGPEGSFLATIREINDDHVILDLNHPLAGEVLNFEIEVMAIHNTSEDIEVTMANWNTSMKKAELLEVAKSRGLPVNPRSTKAQIIEALSALNKNPAPAGFLLDKQFLSIYYRDI